MPRRYPRLSAKDHAGNSVAIPLAIAPRLLPGEHFTSPPQEKVLQIAEANQRLKLANEHVTPNNLLPMKKRIDSNYTTSLTHMPPQVDTPPTLRDSTLRDSVDMDSEHTLVRDSSNTEISVPATASSSDTDSEAETFTRSRRRLWTEEEDELVMCAVLMKEPGSALIERLPHRSKSAVLQRFYMVKERYEREMDTSDGESRFDGDEDSQEEHESDDEDMDEIAPL